MSDSAEHGHGTRHAQWEDEAEEPFFDERMGEALLRSFGLKQMPKRTTTFPKPLEGRPLPKLTAPRMPLEFEHYIAPANDVDLTVPATSIDRELRERHEAASPGSAGAEVPAQGKRLRGRTRTSLRPRKG